VRCRTPSVSQAGSDLRVSWSHAREKVESTLRAEVDSVPGSVVRRDYHGSNLHVKHCGMAEPHAVELEILTSTRARFSMYTS